MLPEMCMFCLYGKQFQLEGDIQFRIGSLRKTVTVSRSEAPVMARDVNYDVFATSYASQRCSVVLACVALTIIPPVCRFMSQKIIFI